MSATVKLEGKLSTGAADGIEPHAPKLYDRLGHRMVGVVELTSIERTQLADDEEKEPTVKIRLSALEIATPDQEPVLRDAMRALYSLRTATGTLTEDGETELAKSTLRITGGRLADMEAARLRVIVRHWAEYARRALAVSNPSATELRHELDTVASGLAEALAGARMDDVDQ